ncbi:hypothetical protein BDM02DRAFT_3191857 [Thelephora ganbajun]|uniref:Uncharacterized protein n=1 Tax=Thelephora ganbajun TaxID=370292 RepID=A0ACB6Z0T5_THEGA|nr:hypothetical protein BDM02DRAFT_3191857 [Thelephora ganbajun]
MSSSYFLVLNGFTLSRRDTARPRPIRSPLGLNLTCFVMSGPRSMWYYPRFPSALYTDSIWVTAMSSFKSNVARGAAAPLGSDITLTDLLMVGLVDWEGANLEDERPRDSMHFAATVAERLLSRLEVIEGQISSHANALQLQSLGLDGSINARVEDRRILLAKNAALDREVGELKDTVAQLEGEFGVLLAHVEALEWVTPSEYLLVEDLLRVGAEGGIEEMDEDVASSLGLRPDFGPLSFSLGAPLNDTLWFSSCVCDGVRLNRHRGCLNTLQDKHNALVSFVGGHSSQLELHRRGLLSLHDRMCMCAAPESPLDGSGAAPLFSSPPSTPRPTSPAVEVEPEETTVVPLENEVLVPVLPPGPAPCRTVVELTTTLRPISEDEARAIEDRIVGAWQRQGADNTIPITLDGSELNKRSGPSCGGRVVELTQEQMGIRSPEARGYRMLSVMRAVTMMPNSTVSTCLLSSDFVGGELQLVFPISQEEFDSLASGEMEAEVHPVVISDVVRDGAVDDKLEYAEE